MACIRRLLRNDIKIVPKIETKVGVNNLDEIVRSAETDMVMLDMDDLFVDAGDEFEAYLEIFDDKVDTCSFYTDDKKLKVLRQQGVIFCDY